MKKNTHLISLEEVTRLVGCSSKELYNLVDKGEYPEPVRSECGVILGWPVKSHWCWIAKISSNNHAKVNSSSRKNT